MTHDSGLEHGAVGLDRRTLLAAGAGLAAFPAAARSQNVSMIDTHIHLFDPNRPQGAPYKGPRDRPYFTKGSFPATYREVMARHSPVAAIHVDASPWVEDNLWVLQLAQTDPIMVGVIGNFRIEAPDFGEMLARHAKWPLLRGVRYGNLWRYDIVAQSRQPGFIDGLKRVADADLVLDSANPRVDLLEAIVRINDAVPGLRIVVDHLCKLDPRPDEQAAYDAVLGEIANRPNIFVKLSASLHEGHVSPAMLDHKPRLDRLFGVFGADRVLFASDWPNVEGVGSVHTAVAIVQEYFAAKNLSEQAKFFWGNSAAVYKWQPRTAEQRRLFG